MTAIVTCGETKQSLSAVRSLGRAHVPVAVCATARPALAMWSRYATSTFLSKDPNKNPESFTKYLAEELHARYATCILVSCDSAFWALSKFREVLPESAKKLLPPHYSVVRSLDHEALYYFAESLGIPCVKVIRISEEDRDTVFEHLDKEKFPLLLHPIILWTEREDGFPEIKTRIVVRTKQHLQSLLENTSFLRHGFFIKAQKTKKAFSYFGVAHKGKVLVEGFDERLNALEPGSEISTLSATIKPISTLREQSQKLLLALSWQGPFKVEFIKDEKGAYFLNSLYGRLWDSLQLAVHAGMDIPLICYRLAEGNLSDEILKNAQPNVRLRWLLGEAQASVGNPLGLLKRFEPKRTFINLYRKPKMVTYYDVLDINDPMPFIFELQSKTWKKAFKRKNR